VFSLTGVDLERRARVRISATFAIGFLLVSLLDRSLGSSLVAVPVGAGVGYLGEAIAQRVRRRRGDR